MPRYEVTWNEPHRCVVTANNREEALVQAQNQDETCQGMNAFEIKELDDENKEN